MGLILSRYRSGKLPKAFKIIPKLKNWEEASRGPGPAACRGVGLTGVAEQIVYLTNPDGWTAASMFEATRLFSSNLKEKMAQR